jgi:Protein of unknown function (DUF3553)
MIEHRSRKLTAAKIKPALRSQPGERVRNQKFGLGTVAEVDRNRLKVEFDGEGRKVVPDSYVKRVS